MTNIEIGLLIYILLGQCWIVIFLNTSRKTNRKTWFAIIFWLLFPITITVLAIQMLLNDKNKGIEK